MNECVDVNNSLSVEITFSLICLYRKPSAKLESYDQLKNLHSLDFNKEVILMGDFNVNWNDKGGKKKH